MNPAQFAAELERFGPGSRRVCSRDEARAYCRQLARRHYENFSVASWLTPAKLRPHLCHVYAFCRWSDDLADETEPGQARPLLAWWRGQLDGCTSGDATHPVCMALAETIREFEIPCALFHRLLNAFVQDQEVKRYANFAALAEYCSGSANPVGRIVLCLHGCHDHRRAELADFVCTGLQLANFCQDVAEDYRQRGRVYLPLDECQQFGVSEADFAARASAASRPSPRMAGAAEPAERWTELLRFQAERAERYLRDGAALLPQLPPPARLSVDLFVQGGLAILREIRQARYDVWRPRIQLNRFHKLRLLTSSLLRHGYGLFRS